jgi:hypothetical protein
MRAETGTIKFGDDWTGVFIRGDIAYAFSGTMKTARKILTEAMNGSCKFEDVYILRSLEGLIQLLDSANEIENDGTETQHMQDYEKCVAVDR